MRNARASLDSVAETEEIGATKIIRRSTSERVLAWLRIKAQRARRLAAFAGAGVALLVVAVLWVGMARVREAERSTRLAEAKLDEVLREQAALASQWQTFRGIQTRDLAELRAQIQSAPDIDSRRVAVDRLLVGVADTLGPLAATGDDTLGEGQVGLRYEVVGAENRVNVEGRRFDEARTRWRSAAATLPGALAVTLGLARMPPHP